MNPIFIHDLVIKTQWFPDFKSITIYSKYNEFLNNLFIVQGIKCTFIDDTFNLKRMYNESECLFFDENVGVDFFKNRIQLINPKSVIISYKDISLADLSKFHPYLKELNYGNHFRYADFEENNLIHKKTSFISMFQKGKKLFKLVNYRQKNLVKNSDLDYRIMSLEGELVQIRASKTYRISEIIHRNCLKIPFLLKLAKIIYKLVSKIKNN